MLLDESEHSETLDQLLARTLFRPGEHWSIEGEAGIGSGGWSAGLSVGYGFGDR